jgi:hypothetical protein
LLSLKPRGKRRRLPRLPSMQLPMMILTGNNLMKTREMQITLLILKMTRSKVSKIPTMKS